MPATRLSRLVTILALLAPALSGGVILGAASYLLARAWGPGAAAGFVGAVTVLFWPFMILGAYARKE